MTGKQAGLHSQPDIPQASGNSAMTLAGCSYTASDPKRQTVRRTESRSPEKPATRESIYRLLTFKDTHSSDRPNPETLGMCRPDHLSAARLLRSKEWGCKSTGQKESQGSLHGTDWKCWSPGLGRGETSPPEVHLSLCLGSAICRDPRGSQRKPPRINEEILSATGQHCTNTAMFLNCGQNWKMKFKQYHL